MLLDRKIFFIKERVAVLKLADTYDILDPETKQQIGIAKEEPGGLIKLLRPLINKQMLPTTVNIYENETQPPVFSIKNPFTLLRSKISIFDNNQKYIGYFKSKIFSLGGGFWVFDTNDQQIAEVKGDWKGWNFKFIGQNGNELGTVTKKWAGIGKELFTSADNYMISIAARPAGQAAASILLLAAGLSIDIIYKEKNKRNHRGHRVKNKYPLCSPKGYPEKGYPLREIIKRFCCI